MWLRANPAKTLDDLQALGGCIVLDRRTRQRAAKSTGLTVSLFGPAREADMRWGDLGYVSAVRPRPGRGPFEVYSARARHGFGPLAYDLCIEATGRAGLTPDRGALSDEAAEVWRFYFAHRPDVRHEPELRIRPPRDVRYRDDPALNAVYTKPAVLLREARARGLIIER